MHSCMIGLRKHKTLKTTLPRVEGFGSMPLWQIDIYPAENQVDREALRTSEEISELGLGSEVPVAFARSFLVQGDFVRDQAVKLAETLLCDAITERSVVAIAGQEVLNQPPSEACATLVNVLPKPGVMDPVAASTVGAERTLGRIDFNHRTAKCQVKASKAACGSMIARNRRSPGG